jgi:hypothetical protein
MCRPWSQARDRLFRELDITSVADAPARVPDHPRFGLPS